jgi:hypothetical protein
LRGARVATARREHRLHRFMIGSPKASQPRICSPPAPCSRSCCRNAPAPSGFQWGLNRTMNPSAAG